MKKINLILITVLVFALSLIGVYALAATPGVSHPADEVEPGSFKNGNYTFPSGNLNISSGNINVNGDVYANWFRSRGNNGWYSQDYGGGWHMTDTTWIRAFNNKPVYSGSEIRSDSLLRAPALMVSSHYFDANDDSWLRVRDGDNGSYKDVAVGQFYAASSATVVGNLVLYGQLRANGGTIIVRNSDGSDGGNIQANKVYSGYFENTSSAWSGDVNISAKNNILLSTTNGAVNVNDDLYLTGTIFSSTGIFQRRNTNYKLILQSDRNLVLYDGSTAVWDSGTATSDVRLKKNVEKMNGVLDRVVKLNGVRFNWIDRLNWGDKKEVGLIAQEVEKDFPELVYTGKDGYKLIHYEKMAPILVEGMKEQQKKIEDLERRLKKLENSNIQTGGNSSIWDRILGK